MFEDMPTECVRYYMNFARAMEPAQECLLEVRRAAASASVLVYCVWFQFPDWLIIRRMHAHRGMCFHLY
jgi:hypothetical protein